MENEMETENSSDQDECEIIEDCDTDLEEDEFEQIIPIRDDSKFIFQAHTNVVLSVTSDRANQVIFTGGMDDTINVWNVETGLLACRLAGHADSVTKLSVNQTDEFLASGDLQGLVIVWRITRNPIKIDKYKSIEVAEIVEIDWAIDTSTGTEQGQESLWVCDKSGTVQSFGIEAVRQDGELCPGFYGNGRGCCCSGFSAIFGGQYAAVLYGGNCDCHEECGNTNQLTLIDTASYHTVKVDLKSVANQQTDDDDEDEGLGAGWAVHRVNQATQLMAIGDWHQLVLASVTITNGPTCKLHRIGVKDAGLITTVAFSDVLPFLAFASKLGMIGVYDLGHNRLRHVWRYDSCIPSEIDTSGSNGDGELEWHAPPAVSQLRWSPSKPEFFTAGLDGRLCVWDARVTPSGDTRCWWGHSGIMWDLCVIKNGSCVVTVSEDKTARLFEI